MWPESARGLRNRWRGFTDPFGDRIVVEATTGLRSEGLILTSPLVRDADAVAVLCEAVADLSDVAHPSLRASREVQRLSGEGGRPVVLSDYSAGQRLSTWLAAREDLFLPTGCVLHIAFQVGGALRAIAEHQAGAFHGAVGLERVLLTPAGKVLLLEAGIGALLAAQPERSPEEWWREYRVAVPLPSAAATFGQTTDACQLGVLVLELLLGRQLAPRSTRGRSPFCSEAPRRPTSWATDYPSGRACSTGSVLPWALHQAKCPRPCPMSSTPSRTCCPTSAVTWPFLTA